MDSSSAASIPGASSDGGYTKHFFPCCGGRKTRAHITKLLRASLRGEFPSADLDAYPAHLHINVDKRRRGQGIGRRLIETYLDQLRQLGVPGVHLHTTSLNEAACRLYARVGFRLLDARPTRAWADRFDRAVENRCYGLRLTPGL